MFEEQNMLQINIKGQLYDFSTAKIMGIVNFTPDSFFEASRHKLEDLASAFIIDVGGYSTRPGAQDVSQEEEVERLQDGVKKIRAHYPNAILSVDTFRPSVAKIAVEKLGVDLINDVSGGLEGMFELVSELQVPYVLTYPGEGKVEKMLYFFSQKIAELSALGVNDILLDPGFGFGKDLEGNYEIARYIHSLHEFNLPILIGISRKSMIQKVIGKTADQSLNGTTALHTYFLDKGVHILRVHDVPEAVECIKIQNLLKQ